MSPDPTFGQHVHFPITNLVSTTLKIIAMPLRNSTIQKSLFLSNIVPTGKMRNVVHEI